MSAANTFRRVLVVLLLGALFTATGGASWRDSAHGATLAVTSDGLLEQAAAAPDGQFRVIVQATDGSAAADSVGDAISAAPANIPGVTDSYSVIPAVAATLTGDQVVALAGDPRVTEITSDGKVVLTGGASAGGFSNSQSWPNVPAITKFWSAGGRGPAIAVVDSGVQAGRSDFDGRVIQQVDLTGGSGTNSPGDGFGHGTFVAGIAAGSNDGHAGAAPAAPIVSLDVMDDTGLARTSDVIAAADWILQHHTAYNIRVANFSLTGSVETSFIHDPLDKAVEALWHSGIVVVAAAGNYAQNGDPSGVLYAPGNDPFIITVGAADTSGTVSASNDFAAPWSAYGYTPDGFRKPELCAPGRVMNGPVPTDSTIYTQHPDRIVSTGYVWLSGTSFAAPVVAGAADYALFRHPSWTPDQVKGALMLTASPTADGSSFACGVGETKVSSIGSISSPPNPNAGLNQFLVDSGTGGPPVFDGDAWTTAATDSASWDSASWDSASWDSASWDSASWDSASWDSASWDSASWDSGTGSDGSLPANAALVWVR
jgi:serine protease AprX